MYVSPTYSRSSFPSSAAFVLQLFFACSNTDDMHQVRSEFRQMRQLFDELKAAYFADEPSFAQLSEGMTDDYPIAIEEGSTIVRIGSMIFGSRGY